MFKLFPAPSDPSALHSLPESTPAFSALELYEFDLNGFLIIRNFISPEQVELCNKLIDQAHAGEPYVEFPFLNIHSTFLDILTHTRIMAICKELLGAWFRFEEAYGVQSDSNIDAKHWGVNLHGGPFANQGSFQYQWHDGRPRCSIIVFGLNLRQVDEGDGGLVVLPGSHNQNTAVSGKELFIDLLKSDMSWPWIKNPKLNPGDLILFTEALIHGTSQWRAKNRERRILYYRYCPGYVAWRNYEQTAAQYLKLARNDLERQLFRGPYVGHYDTQEKPRWKNHYRSPTACSPAAEYGLDGKKIK